MKSFIAFAVLIACVCISGVENHTEAETRKPNSIQVASDRDENTTRVLVVDSSPSWEYRVLSAMLESETSVNATNLLLTDDPKSVLPELADFDVVVLGDVNPKFVKASGFKSIADFVGVRGGGLVVIAGSKFSGLPARGATATPTDLAYRRS